MVVHLFDKRGVLMAKSNSKSFDYLAGVILAAVLIVAAFGLFYIYSGPGQAISRYHVSDDVQPISLNVETGKAFDLKVGQQYVLSVEGVSFSAMISRASKTYALLQITGDIASGEYMLTSKQPAVFDGVSVNLVKSSNNQVTLNVRLTGSPASVKGLYNPVVTPKPVQSVPTASVPRMDVATSSVETVVGSVQTAPTPYMPLFPFISIENGRADKIKLSVKAGEEFVLQNKDEFNYVVGGEFPSGTGLLTLPAGGELSFKYDVVDSYRLIVNPDVNQRTLAPILLTVVVE